MRGEKDKRIYNNLFDHYGLRGIRKLLVIKHMMVKSSCVTTFSELGNYFGDLNLHYDLVKEYFDRIVRTNTIALVMNANLQDKVAIHVRLGDYLPELRIDISWYKSLIENIIALNPNQEFVLFSDGTDQELAPLLQLPNVKKKFYGNAFADMYAISQCKMLIASDSTFSAWGAFLGQKPIIFSQRHFPPVYRGNIPEVVLGRSSNIPDIFRKIICLSN